MKPAKIDALRFSTVGLFVCAVSALLYLSRPVVLPVILALLAAMLLSPFTEFLRHRLGFPKSLAAGLIVVVVSAFFVAGGYLLAGPAAKYRHELGKQEVRDRLRQTFAPIRDIHNELVNVVDRVDDIAERDSQNTLDSGEGREESKGTPVAIDDAASEVVTKEMTSPENENDDAVQVEIEKNSIEALYQGLQVFGVYALSTLALLFFFLCHGDILATRLGRQEEPPPLLREVKTEISSYLLSITAINVGLGIAIGTGLGLLGLPNPILWGTMAALLNFVPYAGAIIGTVIITLVAAMEFHSPALALATPALYLGFSALEGNFVTPTLIGNRFRINPIIVFLWVLAWAAIWGLPGMLIALPILISFRIICAKVPALAATERAMTLPGS